MYYYSIILHREGVLPKKFSPRISLPTAARAYCPMLPLGENPSNNSPFEMRLWTIQITLSHNSMKSWSSISGTGLTTLNSTVFVLYSASIQNLFTNSWASFRREWNRSPTKCSANLPSAWRMDVRSFKTAWSFSHSEPSEITRVRTVCRCVCVCAGVYVHVQSVCVYVCVHVFMPLCVLYVCVCVCMYLCHCVYCMCVCVCMYLCHCVYCMCVCVHVFMPLCVLYVCVCACTCIYATICTVCVYCMCATVSTVCVHVLCHCVYCMCVCANSKLHGVIITA